MPSLDPIAGRRRHKQNRKWPSEIVVPGPSTSREHLTMSLLVKFKVKLQNPERGATAVEYGLMVALIAVVVIVAVTLLGDNLSSLFNTVAGKV
jgi:pilus assembly protein Flp/PilA